MLITLDGQANEIDLTINIVAPTVSLQSENALLYRGSLTASDELYLGSTQSTITLSNGLVEATAMTFESTGSLLNSAQLVADSLKATSQTAITFDGLVNVSGDLSLLSDGALNISENIIVDGNFELSAFGDLRAQAIITSTGQGYIGSEEGHINLSDSVTAEEGLRLETNLGNLEAASLFTFGGLVIDVAGDASLDDVRADMFDADIAGRLVILDNMLVREGDVEVGQNITISSLIRSDDFRIASLENILLDSADVQVANLLSLDSGSVFEFVSSNVMDLGALQVHAIGDISMGYGLNAQTMSLVTTDGTMSLKGNFEVTEQIELEATKGSITLEDQQDGSGFSTKTSLLQAGTDITIDGEDQRKRILVRSWSDNTQSTSGI